ncbi:MAG TPA: type II secretion system F family protein [Gammaproteobacteria bacterium]|nr:type II secretion system F family protein [Gammaproteobacteria bacterium]
MAEKAIKQDVFIWEGSDKRGGKVKGESHGSSPAMIKAELRRRGIVPKKVRKKSTLFSASKGKKIVPKDIAIFSRQLATMMSAGVPLVQSFDIIGRGHENPRMQELLMTIKNDVESGNPLAESLAKHRLYFDDLFCNLVKAGEHAGILEALLHKIATYKEKTEAIKAKIKKALFYPTAVIVVAGIVTGILLIFVVPQFEELFQGFGASLPAFTQMVINLSKFMQTWWFAVLGGLFAVGYLFSYTKKRSVKFAHFLDKLMLKIPIVGNIINKAAIARFARTLSTMFAAGVPLVEAMESVAGATGNIVYSDAILQIRDEVSTGRQLNQSMKDANLFPSMVVQMVAIGEESGALDDMLGKVADFYEDEVDNAVDGLSSLLEPLIMAVLGVLVGGLVIAMYLPIFKLGAVV